LVEEQLSAHDLAEILRKKQKYRDWIITGRIRLSPDKAARLVGPDCLYHLYALQDRPAPAMNTLRKLPTAGK
jgi:hypothetical protein